MRNELDTAGVLIASAPKGFGLGDRRLLPGPGGTGLAVAAPGTVVFLPAMLLGMALAAWTRRPCSIFPTHPEKRR